jgi:DNA-binding SARP family transcriptional activator
MTHSFSLRMLGRFELSDGDGQVSVPAGSERVLAALAIGDGPLSRVRLAGMLWPHATDRRAQASLRSALLRLPARARAAVETTSSVLALSDGLQVDFKAARELAHRLVDPGGQPDGADLCRAAIATLALDLLPDWYDDWAAAANESWRQLRMHALETLAKHLTSTERYSDAIEAALAAVAADPLRESSRAALIRVHLAEGNRSEAVREYDRYQHLLGSELGLEPTGALGRLLDLPARSTKTRTT